MLQDVECVRRCNRDFRSSPTCSNPLWLFARSRTSLGQLARPSPTRQLCKRKSLGGRVAARRPPASGIESAWPTAISKREPSRVNSTVTAAFRPVNRGKARTRSRVALRRRPVRQPSWKIVARSERVAFRAFPAGSFANCSASSLPDAAAKSAPVIASVPRSRSESTTSPAAPVCRSAASTPPRAS